MNIGFFSEAGYEGKVSRNHPNMRTDVAWVCALDATHHPIPKIQTLPDNYTEGVSNTQRYKMLGNGMTCAVIEHILSPLKGILND